MPVRDYQGSSLRLLVGMSSRPTDTTAMSVCMRNGPRNGVEAIEYCLVDWANWEDIGHYDWIIGSDILYGDTTHPHLRRIFSPTSRGVGGSCSPTPFAA